MTYRNLLLILLVSTFLLGCEKVIEVDLDEEAPQLAIEAFLGAGEQDFVVRVSQSGNYFGADGPAGLDNASVLLTDETAAVDYVLASRGDGTFGILLNGQPTHRYRLTVDVNGETYTTTATIPTAVALAELETELGMTRPFEDEGFLIFTRFQDPADTPNFYRFLFARNDTLQLAGEDLRVLDDALFDGGYARVPLSRETFPSGTVVDVILWHLEEQGYNYLDALADIVGEGQGPMAATAAPGNPTNNWPEGVLGTFTTYNADTLRVEIP